MPYIPSTARDFIDHAPLNSLSLTAPGELNYAFTRLALLYLTQNGPNYQTFNDIIGALEGAKLELYRRHVAPYEDYKISQNGDVK